MTGDGGAGAGVLLYGGDRSLRLAVARELRGGVDRVLLASSAAEAAKALGSGGIAVIAALSPLPALSEALLSGARITGAGQGPGHPDADALAWSQRIRECLSSLSSDQPTSSA